MKKRLKSLFLCIAVIVLVFTAFTACNNTGNIADEGIISPMTITLTMVTNEETTEEGIAVVQDAINKIAEKSLNSHIVLQLYTEDEYDAAIDRMIASRQNDIENDIVRLSMGTSEDVEYNEYGREITVYPEPYTNQIDIFMAHNGTELIEYYRQGAIEDVSSALNDSTASLLRKYISDDILSYGKIGEAQYGIPGNSLYGEHEYLFINKALFDKYHYDIDEVTPELSSIENYLVDLAKYESSVTPLYNINYMGLESLTGRPSVVAAYIPEGAILDADTSYSPGNILSNENVRATLSTINAYASICGSYPLNTDEVDFSVNFGAAYVKGSSALPKQYEDDYYVITFRGPTLETDEVFSSMFLVSSYTTDADRCMEVIKLINTNSVIRNLLAYGVENVHYTIDDDTGMVNKIRNPKDNAYYSMSIYNTGNIFLVTPNSDMSEYELLYSANNWALAKQAAADAFKSPNVGFSLTYETEDDLDSISFGIMLEDDIEQLELLYDELWYKIREYDTYVDTNTGDKAEFTAYLDYLRSEWLAKSPYVTYAASSRANDVFTINKQYRAWYSMVVSPDPAEE